MKKLFAAVLACLLALMCFATGAAAIEAQEGARAMEYITYEEHGAVGDGVTDDLDAIVAAHAAANAANLPVKADPDAAYYIARTDKTAVIQTDADWGTAKFIIDDSDVQIGQGHGRNVFEVTSRLPREPVAGVATLKKGQTNIGVALGYAALVQPVDANTIRYIRRGGNANDGAPQREVLLVDGDGNVDPDTPIIWDYDQITSITAIPIDPETLTIKGGHFTTIANKVVGGDQYYGRGIRVARSNVVIDGFEHYVTGEPNAVCAPYSGILVLSDCAQVLVQNSVFTGRRQAFHGSYDFTLSNCANVTFRDCAQANSIHDNAYWGVMGANYIKNVVYDGVSFSRFDAHAGVHNVTIKNSQLGHQGINLIGSGTALIENTTVSGRRFINLRDDYGSVWDGEVIVKNCVFNQSNGSGSDHVLIGGSNDGRHNFGYACMMPRKITIDGLTIRDKRHSLFYFGPKIFDGFGGIWLYITDLFRAPPYPYGAAEEVILRNITTESGMCLGKSMNFPRFRNVQVTRE